MDPGALRLTTIGRKSGQERSVILGYLEDGPDLITLAMNGWDEGHPSWWLNLETHQLGLLRPGPGLELTGKVSEQVVPTAPGNRRGRGEPLRGRRPVPPRSAGRRDLRGLYRAASMASKIARTACCPPGSSAGNCPQGSWLASRNSGVPCVAPGIVTSVMS